MGVQGIKEGRSLPPALSVDPGTLSGKQLSQAGVKPLPASLGEALECLAKDTGTANVSGPSDPHACRDLQHTLHGLWRAPSCAACCPTCTLTGPWLQNEEGLSTMFFCGAAFLGALREGLSDELVTSFLAVAAERTGVVRWA